RFPGYGGFHLGAKRLCFERCPVRKRVWVRLRTEERRKDYRQNRTRKEPHPSHSIRPPRALRALPNVQKIRDVGSGQIGAARLFLEIDLHRSEGDAILGKSPKLRVFAANATGMALPTAVRA